MTARSDNPHVVDLEDLRAHPLSALGVDRLTCLECGGGFQSLSAHLKGAHNMKPAAYKAKWGYSRRTVLSAPTACAAARQRALQLVGRPAVSSALLAGLREEGMDAAEIARTVGLAVSTVRRRLKSGERLGSKAV